MERLTAILASVPRKTTSHKPGDSAQGSRLDSGEKVAPRVAPHCPMQPPSATGLAGSAPEHYTF